MKHGSQLILASATAAAAWFASAAWIPLYADPGRFLVPALGFVALSLIGVALRGTVHTTLVIAAQTLLALGCLLGYQLIADPRHWSAPARLGWTLVAGAHHLDDYSSPAPARFHDAAVLLLACGLLLWLAVETIACTLHRPSIAGFPLLLALTVPITVLDGRLPWWVLVGSVAAWLVMIACGHHQLTSAWGRDLSERAHAIGAVVPGVALVALALGCALTFSAAVPVGRGLSHGQDGLGNSGDLTLGSPMLDLRRDLIQHSHTPMLTVTTTDPDPSYLTLTVLDVFTGSQWMASQRLLPATNSVNGTFPTATGLSPNQPGRQTSWSLALAQTLRTRWLPIPTPLEKLHVNSGDWRFDARTLDVADVSPGGSSEGLRYTAGAFDPDYSATTLNDAGPPVGPEVDGMTSLPAQMPPVIERTAQEVTAGEHTEFNRLVALQRWFRDTGGFRYSTQPAPGSGIALLTRFVTTDKVGYCEQFAAAMAVMGRTLGIPSRVVVGFLRPTGKAATPGAVEFTSDDLHAWPEFYFAGTGWIRFDPTPATRSGAGPAYSHREVHSQANSPTEVSSQAPSPRPAPTTTARPKDSASTSARRSDAGTPWWWLALPLLVIAAGAAPRVARRRQRRQRLSGPGRGFAAGCWDELRASAIDLDLAWPAHGTIRSTLSALQGRVSSDPHAVAELDWLTRLLEASWYAADHQVSDADRARAIGVVNLWRNEMIRAASPRAARLASWLPRSVTDRTRVLVTGQEPSAASQLTSQVAAQGPS